MLLENAERGSGGLVFIAGEAGVGKTRLARQFIDEAGGKGIMTLYAKATSGSSLRPYLPWIECVREFASKTSVLSFLEICGEVSEPMLRLLPEMKPTRPEQVATPTLQEQSWQNRTVSELSTVSPMRYFDAVSQFLFRLSDRGTLILVLDDLQWCDQSSLDLLQYVASNGLEKHRLLILCLYRDTHLESTNRQLLRLASTILSSPRQEANIKLERLDRETSYRLLMGPSNVLRLTDDVCELLHRKTGGNPLFMKETLAFLVQQGLLLAEGSGYFSSPELSEIEVPNSVKEVVRQRLNPVDRRIKEVLQSAALLGESFNLQILREIVVPEMDKGGLLEALRIASSLGLTRGKPGSNDWESYAFADEVIIEVLIEQLSEETFRSCNLRIAQVKEKAYAGKGDERAAELAEHYRNGGNFEKTLEYSLKAGDAANQLNACNEARTHYERALESLEMLKRESRDLERGVLLEKLGDILWIQGEWGRAYSDWEEAVLTYGALGEEERAGSLHCKMGWFQFLAFCDSEKTEKGFEEAMRHFSRIPKGLGLAVLYHHFGDHYCFENKPELARRNLQESIALAKELGFLDVEVASNIMLAFVTPINEKNAIMDCLRNSQLITPEYLRSLSYDISVSFGSTASHALTHTGIALAKLTGNTKAAQEYLLKGLELAEKSRQKRFIIWARTWLSEWGYIPIGEWERARQLVAEAASWSLLGDFPVVKAYVFAALGEISLLEGEIEKAEEFLKVAYDCTTRFGNYVSWDAWHWTRARLGRLCISKGDYDLAEKYLREDYRAQRGECSATLFNAEHFVECLFLLVQLSVKQEKREEAVSYLSQLQEFARSVGTAWAGAYSAWATGVVFSFEEKWDLTIPPLEEAIEGWRSLGWPYQLAGTFRFAGLARMERGEVELAGGLLDEALTIFNRLGAKLDIQQTLAAKEALREQGSSRVFSLSREGSERSKKIFEYLVLAFISDYLTKRLPPDSSGWRSLARVARDTKIPRYRFYVTTGKNPKDGVPELLRLGLIDEKEFPHQRGRGGTATCIRIAYENDDVKKYIERRTRSRGREAAPR